MANLNTEALRHLRIKDGHSIASLARAVGIGAAHLSNIEAGRRGCSPGVTRLLAQTLGVPISAISAERPVDDEAVATREAGSITLAPLAIVVALFALLVAVIGPAVADLLAAAGEVAR